MERKNGVQVEAVQPDARAPTQGKALWRCFGSWRVDDDKLDLGQAFETIAHKEIFE